MIQDVIPENIKQFILRHIDSIAQWEGLLLLRSNPEAEWSAEAVARNLYTTEEAAAEILQQLSASGFIARSGAAPAMYRYQPKSPELDATIENAADLYMRYLVPMTHLIHSKSQNRIRKFADAFRIRKE